MSGNATAANVEETLKDFWVSRPRRPHRGRKIAGVAAGIAERYRIDPVIVRVAFVAMALCNGAGVFIYLLGWLGLPQEDDEVSPVEALVGRGRSSTPIPLTVLLGLALFPATGFFFDGGFTMVAGVLLSVGAVYLLHLNRGAVNRPALLTTTSSTEQVTEMDQKTTATPPAWDPLGAAPFAWDLPEPGQSVVSTPPPPPVRRYRRKSPVTGITLGLSLMVVATAVITGRGDTWFTPLHTLGVVVAIMGVGLLVGSFVRGGRGLIGLVIPLGLVGVLGTVVNLADLNGSGRVGDITESPASIAEVDPEYVLKAGSIQLDLTGLPDAGRVETEVRTVVGTVQVTVPKTADVEVRCEADLGSVRCLGHQSSGTDALVEATEPGTGGAGGLKIVLNVRNGVGDVEVNRG
ncbi:PspC domain-containing protein [Umezawaea sp. Da 62-37]|uniref:PspC domain-containing protein n=1 Tax=Umezawaea sp. Da 62-37 TaxID=3075927 RepID=UPI0028F71C9A|nr:PspC domain-containing protein [Umezawaea sp. Da 62-37]WNV90813.1 PspC domain-containing protein [Umezawaea sp. Da 62-37]